MNQVQFLEWAIENNAGTEFRFKKDQVIVLSCGTKTYTWFVLEGVMFTAMQSKLSEGELANTIWRKNSMVHSLDDDIMLPAHALTDCTLLRFSSEEINAKIKESPELAWYLAEYYHTQFTRTLSNFKHSALDTSEARLAYLEKQLSSIEELEGERVSDAVLALFMGMHRVSVSRIRKKLESSSEIRDLVDEGVAEGDFDNASVDGALDNN